MESTHNPPTVTVGALDQSLLTNIHLKILITFPFFDPETLATTFAIPFTLSFTLALIIILRTFALALRAVGGDVSFVATSKTYPIRMRDKPLTIFTLAALTLA